MIRGLPRSPLDRSSAASDVYKRQLTAWDIYNVATEIYKPGRTDIPAMIPQNGALAELMLSEGLPES